MATQAIQRLALVVQGQVQGVGFRPFIYRLAHEGGLGGTVANTSAGVRVEVQGPPADVALFVQRMQAELPPLARVTSLTQEALPVRAGEEAFSILPSEGAGGHSVLVSPDVGICADCLADIRDAANVRFGYAFTNCTNCGPRYTITRTIPYDRASTCMACFPLCAHCQAEYTDPLNRRFHAQPVACPACGPQLWFADKAAQEAGCTPATAENKAHALERAVELLMAGGILALKGLGGFQLVCDARRAQAVQTVRQRKNRPHKALALMVGDVATARWLCALTPEHEALLCSPEKPIVLCPRGAGAAALPTDIAPDTATLGLMLPYTPLHALLLDRLNQRLRAEQGGEQAAVGTRHAPVLVMTSANAHGEPLCLGNREALARLAHLADGWLLHDRDILVRADDSVLAVAPRIPAAAQEPEARPRRAAGEEATSQAAIPLATSAQAATSQLTGPAEPFFYRRARGFVPRPVFLPPGAGEVGCVLGVGAELKNTLCFTRGAEAFVSQHVGDMENVATTAFFEEVVSHLERLLAVQPCALVCDLHPDFYATRYAEARAARCGLPLWHLQHHAAHAASVLAENQCYEPALCLCLDGTGLGTDGTIWGGEVLFMDLGRAVWQRLGHVSPFALAGGEAAIRQPWRMALALGLEAAETAQARERVLALWQEQTGTAALAVAELLDRRVNCPLTSSCGRLFDAVAAQLGLCTAISYEGQAAIRLETAALSTANSTELPVEHSLLRTNKTNKTNKGLLELHSSGLFAAVCAARQNGQSVADVALAFHHTLARLLADMALQAARHSGCRKVGLSGGVMQNSLMARLLPHYLAERGLHVLVQHELPPGDGGLALGQAVWGRQCLALGRAADRVGL